MKLLTNLNTRQIYTDRYLGLKTVLFRQKEQLEHLQKKRDLLNLESRIIASANKGILLSSDVEIVSQLIVVSGAGVEDLEDIDQSVSDLMFYKDILNKFISLNKHSKISMVHAVSHVTKFYQLCHLMTTPDLALELFDNPDVKEVIPVNSDLASYSHLVLINLLFKVKKYEEVIRVYEEMEISRFQKHYETNSILTLILLAIVKLKLPESFAKATVLVEEFLTEDNQAMALGQEKGRLTNIYAWLSCMDGNYPTAYEIIQAQSKHVDCAKINLKLFTLLKMSKIVEAIFALEDVIGRFGGPGRIQYYKPRICKEVIQDLVQAVNESKDGEIVLSMKGVFSKLDFVAEIVEDSIEDLLFEPIKYRMNNLKSPSDGLVDLRKNFSPKQNSDAIQFF